MYLIQLLLMFYDNLDGHLDGGPRDTLAARFGGLTVLTRVPAIGPWQGDGEHTERAEMVIHRAMVDTRSRSWWAGYRDKQQAGFEQAELIVRDWPVEQR
ncbi:hypothetical protein [Pseudomonas sp. Q2-TVG4-2]|uniref:hypothetical protein n=1 Tax=Pseudomonas sp. Q2-TVG4-2 TaxID=1685699 RepID=UPI0015E646D7|nr:hypothetical protein [Pseudomonas sp. Q2-TVG4-2]